MALTNPDANWTQALADLREAPAKPRSGGSLRQAIIEAIDDVISCRERGHTDSDIVAIFARNGIHMSLHTFRQYVRQARRMKTEQALGGKGKAVRASKAQGHDIRGEAVARNTADARDADTTRTVVPEAQRAGTPVMKPAMIRTDGPAPPISQTVPKPLTQTAKTAAEVLGHRFNEDV
ncbi:hypothetical protein [Methylocystis iwaonis]|uniref:hypothetical protein n=1 Tax=Methylocystis iwaonis TaxID=2885079 RepID=UPI002E7B8AEA|nr:hypothetical protein [Methylocystis iwaonis]